MSNKKTKEPAKADPSAPRRAMLVKGNDQLLLAIDSFLLVLSIIDEILMILLASHPSERLPFCLFRLGIVPVAERHIEVCFHEVVSSDPSEHG